MGCPTLAVQADGKIVVGGAFNGTNSIGGQTRNFIARLDPNTGLADSFNPNANDFVQSISIQADGKIVVSGGFGFIGGQTRVYIARLDPTTGLADSFVANANNHVYSTALQADGKILAGGFFTTIGGQSRSLFARLSNDTAALQNLAVSQTAVTWGRGGSSAQLARVTFEYSTDNVIYTPLGNGIPQSGSSNWTLTGLNLATLQNIYIRARGYYHDGFFTGSESIAELVQNAYLATPTPTPTPAPTPTPTPTPPTAACTLTEQFNNITTLVPGGWFMQNNSSPVGTTGWFQGNPAVFPAQSGAANSYIGANFNNTTVSNTISDWLLTPPMTLQNGGVLIFWTRTVSSPSFPDRLQVRMSTNGTSQNVGSLATDVGDFTTLFLDINPTYAANGYPNIWTQYNVTLSGISGTQTGRLAFRYFVENGGPTGANSDYIGIDSVAYNCNGTPVTPTPAPTPTPTPSPTPTPTPAPTATPLPGGGGSALDGFDPNANGEIDAVVVQADGKILLGGGFTTLSPNGGGAVTRNHIARLNPDGTLDPTFDPNADGTVFSIVTQADGKILAGGSFTTIGGQSRNRIARLDATTGLADSFNPNANNVLRSITVQPDGKILVGGYFDTVGGQSRNHIARLDPTTGLADAFNPSANDSVASIAVQADGKILLGGDFTSLAPNGGAALRRNYMARVYSDGTLDPAFNPNASGLVRSVAVQADGKILVSGDFSTITGQTRNYIARIDPTTGLVDSFNPNANAPVYSVAVQPDGKILAGGAFSGANSIGGQTRNRIARLDPTTGLAESFNPNANDTVLAIAVQSDNRILIGGYFTNVGGLTRNRIARLNSNGTVDQTFNLFINNNRPRSLVPMPPRSTTSWFSPSLSKKTARFSSARFTHVGNQLRNNIARLNPDSCVDNPDNCVDTTFNPDANGEVHTIAVQKDDTILAGGLFTNIGGQPRNGIARLNASGGADLSFDPANGAGNAVVDTIATQPDGGFWWAAVLAAWAVNLAITWPDWRRTAQPT